MARRTTARNTKGQFVKKGSGGTRRQYGTSRKRSAIKRRSNPGLKNMAVGGVKVYPAAYDAVGIVAGTYFGGAAANLVSNQLVGRLPSAVQGVGWLAAGIGTIMLGRYLKKKSYGKNLPIDYTAIGLAVPMLVEAMNQLNVPGFGASVPPPAPSPVATEVTAEGTIRGGYGPTLSGTIQPRGLPGSMGGSIRSTIMPGASMGRTRMRMLR